MIEIVIAVFVSVVMASASPATIWGGDHIEMQVTDRGATIEFDCAHGTIDTAIAPDAAGRFEIAGTFTPERGAAREETSQTLKATYAGTVVDDTMTRPYDASSFPAGVCSTCRLHTMQTEGSLAHARKLSASFSMNRIVP